MNQRKSFLFKAQFLVLLHFLILVLLSCSTDVKFVGNQKTSDAVRFETFDQTFPAALISDDSITFQADARRVTQELTLTKAPFTNLKLYQTDRLAYNENFTQGHDGAIGKNTDNVSAGKQLDLLIIVDDSSSMSEEQQKLSEKLEPLLSKLQDINWQIAVVTTSSSCIRNNRIIKKGDSDYQTTFVEAVKAGVNGDDIEQGAKMAIQGLRGECSSGNITPWIREASTVAVLILADEDNCGVSESDFDPATQKKLEQCYADPEGGDPQHLVDYLKTIRPATTGPSQARIYSLIWEPDSVACDMLAFGSFGQRGTKYAKAATDTGGVTGCIYQNDYTSTLTSISTDVSAFVKTQFALDHVPDLGTLKVTIDGVTIAASDYELNGKVLTLKTTPSGAIKISLDYIYDTVPKTSVFPISTDPAPDSVVVTMKVGGLEVNPGSYEIQTSPKLISFETLPPDNASISVVYRENTPLQSNFSLGTITTDEKEPITLTINGNVTTNYTLKQNDQDQTTTTLYLPEAPSDGAEIVFSYREPEDVVTIYKAIANAPLSETITAVDSVTGEEIKATLNGEFIEFDRDLIEEGRKILLTYNFGTIKDILFELPSEPLEGTVHFGIALSDEDPTSCGEFQIDSRKISFNCPIEPLPPVKVDYQYILQEFHEFTIPLPDNPKITSTVIDKGKWRVFVNDEELKNFEVRGTTIIISEDEIQDPWSSVRIVLGLWIPKE